MSHRSRLFLFGVSTASLFAIALAACAPPEPATPNNQGGAIPEQPSTDAMAKAMGSVLPEAKACVAGADDTSRAQLTFVSDGSVINVSVTGWAASNGRSECVATAFKKARVDPFSKPKFTAGMQVRP